MPGRFFPVNGHYSDTGTVEVRCWHIPSGTGAELRWGAGGNPDNIGDIFRDLVPDFVGDHKAEGASDGVLWTLMPRNTVYLRLSIGTETKCLLLLYLDSS